MATIDLKKTVAELIQQNPEVGRVLGEMGIECSSCIASQVDTLDDVVRMYSLNREDLLSRIQLSERSGGQPKNLSR